MCMSSATARPYSGLTLRTGSWNCAKASGSTRPAYAASKPLWPKSSWNWARFERRHLAITESNLTDAEDRVLTRRQAGYVVAAVFDRVSERVVLTLNTQVQISFPPDIAEGLAGASAEDLAVIEVSPSGLGLHWPRLEADLYLPGLLNGQMGSKRWGTDAAGAARDRSPSLASGVVPQESGAKRKGPLKTSAPV